MENTSLAQELTNELYKKCYGHNIIKLDMEKAYDRLEWDFLFLVLQKFGFHHQWIKYIQAMFTNCWFSLLYNGGVHGFFKSSRGLRQGDPLAPTLFIIAEEVLSRGLSMAFSQRQITYYKVPRNCPKVTHLLFADDTLVFKNGDKRSIQGLLQFNNLYELGN